MPRTPKDADPATADARPKRTRAKAADGSTPARAKKPAEPKKAADAKPAAEPRRSPGGAGEVKMARAKKPAGPRKPRAGKAAPPAPRNLKRALMWEAATWIGAVAVGLTVTGGLLWMRAKGDVAAYLADPPRTVPGVVWSAPIEVRPGQAASIPSVAGDLLAAGYDRVERISADPPGEGCACAGEFAVLPDGLDILTHGQDGVPAARTRLRIRDGRVVEGAPAVLRPTVLATIGEWEGRRSDVELGKISPFLEPALLAMEDQRFRTHSGVDPWGLGRAVLSNLAGGDGPGGSTLTQQLAKNLFLSSERTLRRKVREVFFAAALESDLDKDALLELYLREVYLGQLGGVPLYGVESASRAWFGVSAERLELHQVATIIGVIPAPNAYSPRRHPERAEERRNLVLDQMARLGAVTRDQADAAKAKPLVLDGALPGAVRRAPWAVDLAVDDAETHVGEGALASRGMHVHTSIQPLLQRAAEEAVATGLAELRAEYPKAEDAQIALVAVRVSDGAIVAMVGSRNYAESPFNRAVNAWRQAGSTVKPLTLLAAFDADPSLNPLTTILDEPITRRIDGKTWTPQNYDNKFLGEITLRTAIETSRNIPAVKLAEDVGPNKLQAFLREAGLSRATHLPSASLGGFETTPLELATAYTAFPGGGSQHASWVVDRVTEADGAPLVSPRHPQHDLATARAAGLTTSVLHGVIERGTGASAREYGVTGRVGGKSGTTSEYRDAWFVGFTDTIAVAVWVGMDRGEIGLSGSRAALPTWARFVAASGTAEAPRPLPAGVVAVEICTESHLPARPECTSTYEEHLPEADVPDHKCDVHGGPLVEAGRAIGRLFGKKEP